MADVPSYVSPADLRALIQRALKEDIGTGDITSEATIPPNAMAEGRFMAKADGIIAGTVIVDSVFEEIDGSLNTKWTCNDGGAVLSGQLIGTVHGPASSIIKGERLALNLMQRMSGIASETALMCAKLSNSRSRLLDTRKTVPGLRQLDKWAVAIGGGLNHRVGLFDMYLIKENHIVAAGGIHAALDRASHHAKITQRAIEIEVQSLDELQQVLDHGGAQRVMLDNFVSGVDTNRLKEALRLVDGRLETEASGNVSLVTIEAIGKTGVDFISCGSLTHSVKALDISLLVELDPSVHIGS